MSSNMRWINFFWRSYRYTKQDLPSGLYSHWLWSHLTGEKNCWAPLFSTNMEEKSWQTMATEQTQSADEDSLIWLKAQEKASKRNSQLNSFTVNLLQFLWLHVCFVSFPLLPLFSLLAPPLTLSVYPLLSALYNNLTSLIQIHPSRENPIASSSICPTALHAVDSS